MNLLDKIKRNNWDILEMSDADGTKIPLFRDNTFNASSNNLILNSTNDYVISTKRFDNCILIHE